MEIYQKAGYITVTYYEHPKYILFDWTRLGVTLEELKTLHLKAYEVIQAKRVTTLIAETLKVKDVLFKECVEWWGHEHVPRLSKAGVQRIITVIPQTALGRASTKSWQGIVEGIELHNVVSLEEAKKLIV